jgi:dienelactone hydrolase
MDGRDAAPAKSFSEFVLARARELRAGDRPPADLREWETRRKALREAMFRAMGPFPATPEALDVREVGTLRRADYRIEKLVIRTRPGVWATASAYVPENASGRVPAVLAVHGHWAGARRDPVVQSRCVGLVKLGFFVLALDAFGAGERHPTPAPGAYHGALQGSALWPAGYTLLGMQVYDNRRMVDYLLTRPEVDGTKLGITGASGGGNQSMYAGALDERLGAVVPVCSVGTYRAYLKAACCVCEVLPGALEFTEEGGVLGLVAPRALMVINATKDAFQFSVGEASESIEYARAVYKLYSAEGKLAHRTFESPHAYNQAMREAMYGWMTKWLKGVGEGRPIPEPELLLEKPEDLACYPDGKRPAGFLFPASFAAGEARRALASLNDPKLDHREAWESASMLLRETLLPRLLSDAKRSTRLVKVTHPESSGEELSAAVRLTPEPGVELTGIIRTSAIHYAKALRANLRSLIILLHLGGKDEALKHPLVPALLERGSVVVALESRSTGGDKPSGDAVAGAEGHNSAEHALWIGRPLLGQWVIDVRSVLDSMERDPEYGRARFGVVGIGQAGLVALCSAAVDRRIASAAVLSTITTLVSDDAYAPGTHMGLLLPGLLTVADVPHLAALLAPRPLVLSGGVTPQGKKQTGDELQKAFAFVRRVYSLEKAEKHLLVADDVAVQEIADRLADPGRP